MSVEATAKRVQHEPVLSNVTVAWMRQRWLPAVLALLVYAPSLLGGFLYDDHHIVLENRRIQDLRAVRTVLLYEPSRPVLNLTWAINYALTGTRPWPYHLVNVLIHAANAALLTSLFLWMARRRRQEPALVIAVLGASLFAISPMAAETVAYVASRSTALVSLWMLASLRCAVSALTSRRVKAMVAALALFLLALGTKEEAASLPFFLLLLDLFFVAEGRLADVRRRWAWHLPFWVLPVAGLLARRAATGSWLPPPVMARALYLLTQVAAFPSYVLRALVPVDPALYRGIPPATWPPHVDTMLGVVVTGVLIAFAAWAWRRWPIAAFALAWLGAGLLPSSSIVPLNEMVVDHRAYLGGAAFAFLWGVLLVHARNARLAAGVLVILALVSVRCEWILADPVRAWEDATRRAPHSAEAQRDLADAYAARGDARAFDALHRAAALDPRDARSWANLGILHAQAGRLGPAIDAMRRAAAIAPDDARLHHNLGLLLDAQGRHAEAGAELEAAVALNASLAQPRIDLAALLIEQGQTSRAGQLLSEAARLEIDEEDARRIEELRLRLQ